MKREYIFIGPPGSGKGTQTIMLSREYKLPHIDTGALLRAEIASGSEIGERANERIKKGQLVPIEIVSEIIKNRLKEKDCENGFILDGYPRSLEQAKALDKIFEEIDGTTQTDRKVFYFDIAEDSLIERLVNRRTCPKCGEIFNLKTIKGDTPPLKPLKRGDSLFCPHCEAELTQRKDDTEEVAKARFETYFSETHPLIDLYSKRNLVCTIQADKDIKTVYAQLKKAVEKNGN
ncbi:adenylate kinase [bacterium]|nr:adenylate kinase [bacterium]